MKIRRRSLAALTATLGLTAANLPAQVWTATVLPPSGAAESSEARGLAPGQPAGFASFGGAPHAGYWTGAAASFVDLHPAGANTSVVAATDGAQQVGDANFGGQNQAVRWTGTAASIVNLHPADPPASATASATYALSDARQAGFARIGGQDHAALWTGTADSFVDLHPAVEGATASVAKGISGEQQVGYVIIGGFFRAALWSGTAASFLDLTPAGPPFNATSASLEAIAGGQQAGSAAFGGTNRAGIWAGTPESFVELHPAGAGSSRVLATTGARQAGVASNHAAFWAGTPESFVDLHAFLPPGYDQSTANALWTDGGFIFVAGTASQASGRSDAILWKFDPNPPPTPTPPPTPPASAPTFTVLAKSTRPTTRATVTLRGSVTDPDGGAPRVFVKVGPRKFRPARLAGSGWRFPASLALGKNRVLLYAQDSSGLRSPTRKLSLTRRP